jgi:hypothetical protein
MSVTRIWREDAVLRLPVPDHERGRPGTGSADNGLMVIYSHIALVQP